MSAHPKDPVAINHHLLHGLLKTGAAPTHTPTARSVDPMPQATGRVNWQRRMVRGPATCGKGQAVAAGALPRPSVRVKHGGGGHFLLELLAWAVLCLVGSWVCGLRRLSVSPVFGRALAHEPLRRDVVR